MKVFCVIVSYHPKFDNLNNICRILLQNNVNVIVVDNTDIDINPDISLKNIFGINLISLNENIGIAQAQNIGVKKALNGGADVIVFFDQDSEIGPHFLKFLLEPIIIDNPMIVSPLFIDKKTGFQFPLFRLTKIGILQRINVEKNTDPCDVDIVISSGCAATKKTFLKAGFMKDELFIDFVDTEWSLRCRSLGIPIKAVPKAIMQHSIGEKYIDLHILKLFIHNPIRTYYKNRNSFLFMRYNYIPLLFRIRELVAALIHNFIVIFFVKDKILYLKIYCSSIFDGIAGKNGVKLFHNKYII